MELAEEEKTRKKDRKKREGVGEKEGVGGTRNMKRACLPRGRSRLEKGFANGPSIRLNQDFEFFDYLFLSCLKF